jgi:hypothetical protein
MPQFLWHDIIKANYQNAFSSNSGITWLGFLGKRMTRFFFSLLFHHQGKQCHSFYFRIFVKLAAQMPVSAKVTLLGLAYLRSA